VTVRQCLPWPAPCLRRPAAAVAAIDDAIHAHWSDMIDTMEAMPGVGLAAPQIGVALQLAVVDASPGRGQAVRMANPEILWVSDSLETRPEASPNLRGLSAPVARPDAVRLRFLNAAGAVEERAFQGLWATSAQHQVDHLQGRMYFDRLSRVRRDMLLKKARKIGVVT